MKRWLWTALPLALVSAQGMRAAPPVSLYADFLRDCAAHVGDAAAPLNEVSQQGWRPIPQQQLQAKVPPIVIPGLKTEWYHAYVSARSGRSAALFAGRGQMFSGTALQAVPVAFCMILQKPLDAASLEQIGRWAATSSIAGGPDSSAYLFTETKDGKRGALLSTIYRDFRDGVGRELVTMSRPSENTSAAMLVAPVSMPGGVANSGQSDSSISAEPVAQAGPDVPATLLTVPSADQLSAFYPEKDAPLRKSGLSVIRCKVAANGILTTCEIVSAKPLEFGIAALKAAHLFKARPATRNGAFVEGTIDVSTTWNPPS